MRTFLRKAQRALCGGKVAHLARSKHNGTCPIFMKPKPWTEVVAGNDPIVLNHSNGETVFVVTLSAERVFWEC